MVRLTTLPMETYAPEALRRLTPHYRMTTNELLMARLTCTDGLGIGWLPMISCQRFVREGALTPLMPEYHYALPLWLIYRITDCP